MNAQNDTEPHDDAQEPSSSHLGLPVDENANQESTRGSKKREAFKLDPAEESAGDSLQRPQLERNSSLILDGGCSKITP